MAAAAGRVTSQYLANALSLPESVAITRVSVLSDVPWWIGSSRKSIATLIHPGCDHARKPAASRSGGAVPPVSRQAWLMPLKITA
jgi:hypothetical protein